MTNIYIRDCVFKSCLSSSITARAFLMHRDCVIRLQLESVLRPLLPSNIPAQARNLIPRFFGNNTARFSGIKTIDPESLNHQNYAFIKITQFRNLYICFLLSMQGMVCLSPKVMLFKSVQTPKLEEIEKTHPHGNKSKFIVLQA